MSNIKESNQFDALMKRTDKIGDTIYKATTAKRRTVIVPEGITIYDTDEKKYYEGDGSTYGGASSTSRLAVRKIATTAATSGGLSASATTDKVTWTTYGGYLRTGDAITIAAGTGTVPSGTSATTYYAIKDAADQASDSFKIATSRANALAGTNVNILSSGVAGYTGVIAQVAVQGFEDVLILDPVAATTTVYLPYPDTDFAPQITVKRALAGNFTVTIAALTSGGAAATLTCDDAAANLTMASGVARGYTLWGDPGSHEYFTIGKVIA